MSKDDRQKRRLEEKLFDTSRLSSQNNHTTAGVEDGYHLFGRGGCQLERLPLDGSHLVYFVRPSFPGIFMYGPVSHLAEIG